MLKSKCHIIGAGKMVKGLKSLISGDCDISQQIEMHKLHKNPTVIFCEAGATEKYRKLTVFIRI